MRITRESRLPCSPEAAWEAVRTSALLIELAWPLVTIHSAASEPLPERWPDGGVVLVRSKLFGFIPLGVRKVGFERVDHVAHELQTRESDLLVRKWDHRIVVRPAEGGCLYRDEIEIEAVLLTPVAWMFTQVLFWHRHRRWQVVARRLAAADGSVRNGDVNSRCA